YMPAAVKLGTQIAGEPHPSSGVGKYTLYQRRLQRFYRIKTPDVIGRFCPISYQGFAVSEK
ncbi:MAG TPA: hypothetical protein H9857_10620, partial [Candidatus Desulfovibrio intestinigallinarum]|nr:hypothetical protein [Candidatus Desulfovibrio intestinigallinarum]